MINWGQQRLCIFRENSYHTGTIVLKFYSKVICTGDGCILRMEVGEGNSVKLTDFDFYCLIPVVIIVEYLEEAYSNISLNTGHYQHYIYKIKWPRKILNSGEGKNCIRPSFRESSVLKNGGSLAKKGLPSNKSNSSLFHCTPGVSLSGWHGISHANPT